MLILDVYILFPIVQDHGEPPPMHLQSIHDAMIKCEIRIDFGLLEIGSRYWRRCLCTAMIKATKTALHEGLPATRGKIRCVVQGRP